MTTKPPSGYALTAATATLQEIQTAWLGWRHAREKAIQAGKALGEARSMPESREEDARLLWVQIEAHGDALQARDEAWKKLADLMDELSAQ